MLMKKTVSIGHIVPRFYYPVKKDYSHPGTYECYHFSIALIVLFCIIVVNIYKSVGADLWEMIRCGEEKKV